MHKAPDVINELLSISPQSINKAHEHPILIQKLIGFGV